MPRAKKSKVEGAGPSRSAGGRPRKHPAELPPEAPPLEPSEVPAVQTLGTASSAQPPESESSPAPTMLPQTLEAPLWEPTPTNPPRFPHPPRWRYNQPLSTDVVPSWIVRPRFLSRLQVEQKAALKRKRPYINGVCTCEKDGVPSASTETAHSMFCQLYRCYAYEAGGCDGRVDPPKSKDDPTIMTGWECECIQFAFDPDYDTGGENADLLISRSRRHVRSHVDEYGLIDRPGGRALRCNCECNYVGGPYVPMCPFRPHGVTGLARGDMYKRLRAAWDGRGGWEWEEPPEDLSPWYSKRGVNV